MFGIGAGELIMILIAGLVIFGPGKLPEVGRAIGKGLREFRKAQAMFRATLDEVSLENKENPVTLEKPPAENVTADKTVTVEKTAPADKAVTADKTVSIEKNVTADKAVTVEKALPLDNPTENISREKIIEATKEVFEEKKMSVNVDDVIQMAKDNSISKQEDIAGKNENSATDNNSAVNENVATTDNNSTINENVTTVNENSTADKVTAVDKADKIDSADKNKSAEKKTALNVYDVINIAKNNSFVKEKVYEKIFGGTDPVAYNAYVGKCIDIARGSTDGIGK